MVYVWSFRLTSSVGSCSGDLRVAACSGDFRTASGTPSISVNKAVSLCAKGLGNVSVAQLLSTDRQRICTLYLPRMQSWKLSASDDGEHPGRIVHISRCSCPYDYTIFPYPGRKFGDYTSTSASMVIDYLRRGTNSPATLRRPPARSCPPCSTSTKEQTPAAEVAHGGSILARRSASLVT